MEILTVHEMLLYFINLNRSERSKSHVQSNLTVANALGSDPLEKLIGEMQACGRSSSRAFFLGVHGLIVVLILQLLGDIWRERHISDLVECLIDILVFIRVVLKFDGTVSAFDKPCHSSAENTAEVK